jgi:hypothetical protein
MEVYRGLRVQLVLVVAVVVVILVLVILVLKVILVLLVNRGPVLFLLLVSLVI